MLHLLTQALRLALLLALLSTPVAQAANGIATLLPGGDHCETPHLAGPGTDTAGGMDCCGESCPHDDCHHACGVCHVASGISVTHRLPLFAPRAPFVTDWHHLPTDLHLPPPTRPPRSLLV